MRILRCCDVNRFVCRHRLIAGNGNDVPMTPRDASEVPSEGLGTRGCKHVASASAKLVPGSVFKASNGDILPATFCRKLAAYCYANFKTSKTGELPDIKQSGWADHFGVDRGMVRKHCARMNHDKVFSAELANAIDPMLAGKLIPLPWDSPDQLPEVTNQPPIQEHSTPDRQKQAFRAARTRAGSLRNVAKEVGEEYQVCYCTVPVLCDVAQYARTHTHVGPRVRTWCVHIAARHGTGSCSCIPVAALP